MLLDWITVILLIGIGLVLIIVELIFVPGTTIVGVLGFVLAVIGIWIGYAALGTTVGHIVLAASVLVSALTIFQSFRSDAWSKYALKNSNRGHVNEENPHLLEEGEIGKALSALRPSGTALFRDRHHEVHTNGEFIEPSTAIRVVKISQNKILVEEVS